MMLSLSASARGRDHDDVKTVPGLNRILPLANFAGSICGPTGHGKGLARVDHGMLRIRSGGIAEFLAPRSSKMFLAMLPMGVDPPLSPPPPCNLSSTAESGLSASLPDEPSSLLPKREPLPSPEPDWPE